MPNPFILINNQDNLLKILVHYLNKRKLTSKAKSFRLYFDPIVPQTLHDVFGNKINTIPQLLYLPLQGEKHSFIHDKNVFWMSISRDEPKITTNTRKIQFITTLKLEVQSESVQPIRNLIESILQEYKGHTQDSLIYENSGAAWILSKNKKLRPLDSVILEKHISQRLIEDLQQFIDSEKWYKKMGVPYRRCYLLHGPPGTGKSSFTQAIAGHFKYSICFINVSDRMNDFGFNSLLNHAPRKSIILIEDVDAMFDGRKNKQQANFLTYSGFLNAIDGVRSQEGRIIIMTTNHKQRLDPALLRPGRTDAVFELNYANRQQIYRLCYRFFEDQQLAEKLSNLIPENTFSMSQLQGFFVKYKRHPKELITRIDQLLNTEENISVEDFLESINCAQVVGEFKLEGCFSLSSVKNLPNEKIQKLVSSRLSKQKMIRLIEALRINNFKIERSKEEYIKFLNSKMLPEDLHKQILNLINNFAFKSILHLKDKIILREKEIKAEEFKKKNKKKANQQAKVESIETEIIKQ